MKEPIEELFKQSLKGHKMPYNAEAWKAMSARLDVVSPVAAPISYLKYYIGAAVIGVAAVTTYVLLSSGNSTEINATQIANETTIKQSTTPTNKSTTGKRDTQSGNSSVISNPTETPISSDKGLQNTSNSNVNGNNDPNGLNPGVILPGPVPGNEGKVDGTHQNNTTTVSNKETTPINTDIRRKMTMPAIDDLCLNEETTITNPNSTEIYILDGLKNKIKTIPANKSVIFTPSAVGNYSLGYKNDSNLESVSNFQVNRIPDADFMIDFVNKYDNGVPSTHVEAISGQGTYVWNAKNQSVSGIEAEMHFYKKGDQTIELTVNNGQCSTTIEKTIFIENDYNLMAVTGFTPLSTILSKRTFMPFALTQRDVNFTLMIIDSRDGGVVYETSDASLPWDGTDIRSGKRSQTPQVYVWKAVIFNPAANEPSEYRGTITMN
ncbi:MAG: hypothetical protein COA38_20715 [Fluviicola sp.]|nr:MAG: hypothetical protein COA38_20715 [Fluviicola sp.]